MTRPLSDRTLRRLAWTAWWVMPLGAAISIPLMLSSSRARVSSFDLALVVLVAIFPLVGLLILRRQPRNTIGWVLIAIGLAWGVSGLLDDYAVYGLLVAPGTVPGADVAFALNQGAWAPGFGLMGTFLILLFPDGHLPSPRWAPVAWVAGLALTGVTLVIAFMPGPYEDPPVPGLRNPVGWQAGEGVLQVLLVVFLPLVPLSVLACAAGLVTRFRRSSGVERQQLKWLASAGAVVGLLYGLAMLCALFVTTGVVTQTPLVSLVQNAGILSFMLLPGAIGLAVLRHGLYQIDVVINRALVYTSLTATLLLVYLGSVLLLQIALAPLTNESDVAVAGSTLAVAALFGPARSRIQRAVDQRFYRSRYDAELTVDLFATRLRDEVDLDAVGADLLTAVDSTMQPAHASLWVRS